MPELETEMESHPEQAGLAKRKIDFSKRDKDRERELENAREYARDIIEEVICQSEVEHDCGVSTLFLIDKLCFHYLVFILANCYSRGKG